MFDGVDTREVKPDPAAAFTLPDGRELSRADEVITYVARNLEPYRGFPTFMKALAHIQRLRPNAHIVVVGGDAVSYGSAPKDGKTWRETWRRRSSTIAPACSSSDSCPTATT